MKSILKTLKLLTDPTRLRIINVLDEESLSVAELQEILGMGQSRISTQLAQLRQEGLVEDTRSGKNVFYTLSLADDLHNVALKACGELPEAEADKKALQVILDKRRNRTQAYFDEVVCRLGKNYAPGRSWKALAGALLRILNYDVVARPGGGRGVRLPAYFSQRQKGHCGGQFPQHGGTGAGTGPQARPGQSGIPPGRH